MFRALIDDIRTAAIHFAMYRDLKEEFREYEIEMYQAPAFWSLTMAAHLISATSALARAFDTVPDSINLAAVINQVRHQTPFPPKDIRDDIKSVSQSDPLAAKLIWQRHNLFAHRLTENALSDGTVQEQNELTYSEWEMLIKRAGDLINKYDSVLRRQTSGFDIVSKDDFLTVLKSVRAAMAVRKTRLAGEVAEYEARRRAVGENA